MIHRNSHVRVLPLICLIQPASGKNNDSVRSQCRAQLGEYVRLCSKRHVPDAVPRGDKIIILRWFPQTDVRVMENSLRVSGTRQTDHFCREIKSFDIESFGDQEIHKSATAPAANIDCTFTTLRELKRTPVLGNAIGTVECRIGPLLSQQIVTRSDFRRIHSFSEMRE